MHHSPLRSSNIQLREQGDKNWVERKFEQTMSKLALHERNADVIKLQSNKYQWWERTVCHKFTTKDEWRKSFVAWFSKYIITLRLGVSQCLWKDYCNKNCENYENWVWEPCALCNSPHQPCSTLLVLRQAGFLEHTSRFLTSNLQWQYHIVNKNHDGCLSVPLIIRTYFQARWLAQVTSRFSSFLYLCWENKYPGSWGKKCLLQKEMETHTQTYTTNASFPFCHCGSLKNSHNTHTHRSIKDDGLVKDKSEPSWSFHTLCCPELDFRKSHIKRD